MFTTDLVNLYNWNIFKTSLYIYIGQDEKCRLKRNLSLSMSLTNRINLTKFQYEVVFKGFQGYFFSRKFYEDKGSGRQVTISEEHTVGLFCSRVT